MTEPEVLYQDQDLWVIAKPPGWVVNDADTTAAPTVQEWWRAQRAKDSQAFPNDWQEQVPADFDPLYGTPEEIFTQRDGIVHRLDKDTSGVLVLACHPGSLVQLLAQFRLRQTTKTYTALVHGKFQVPSGLIDAPLGRATRDRKLFDVRIDGRPAQTKYSVQQEYSQVDANAVFAVLTAQQRKGITAAAFRKRLSIYQGFSLVECQPLTGRTHQIRVHMAHLQHPLVGDTTYLGRKRQALDPLWCPRHFLHAAKIEVTHPRTREKIIIEASLPADLQQALEYLS